MKIEWLGHSCFRLSAEGARVVTDPYGPQHGVLPTTGADLVTVSHEHTGHSAADAVSGDPFVVEGPGEYEVNGVFVIGVRTAHDPREGKDRGLSTAYSIRVGGVTVCHLGDIGHLPTQAQIEALGAIDVLLVPVGGQTTIGAPAAAETVSLLDPGYVVPMHFRSEARPELDPVARFMQEMGSPELEPSATLTVEPGRLPEEPSVVLLARQPA